MPEIDIILTILETLIKEKPDSVFVNSLHQQYCNRGGLSKKQLEGLYAKAEKASGISAAKLATLQAIIKKKPTRFKSEIIRKLPEAIIDNQIENSIAAILQKYPHHKMALFLQSKINSKTSLTESEKTELRRLSKILLK